jgi:DNA-damage-inducible protein D
MSDERQLTLFGFSDVATEATSQPSVDYNEDGQAVDYDATISEHIGGGIRHERINGVTHYSLVDICASITGTGPAQKYWRNTKQRLTKDGFQLGQKISQLKLTAGDGKKRLTDVADVETCLRIVQSIPSAKAEPIRRWLAHVAHEHIKDAINPNRAIERRKARLLAEGRDPLYIEARISGVMTVSDFKDNLYRVCPTINFGAAFNTEYRGLFGMTAAQLRESRGGVKQTRDALTRSELHLVGWVEAKIAELFAGQHSAPEHECLRVIDEISNRARMMAEMDAVAPMIGGAA